MPNFLAKLAKDTSGNVLVLAGAGTMAMIGGAGLGVDTIQWYLWKRQLQQAVDSSALAGAQAISQGDGYRPYAVSELKSNSDFNFLEDYIGVPRTGTWVGDAGAVEVVATFQRALPFSSAFIAAAPELSARAVATSVADGEFCMRTLAATGVGVKISGTADVKLGCGVSANSASSTAFDFDGGAKLSGSPLSAVGGVNYDDRNIDSGAAVQSYGVEQDDPYASVYSMSDVPTPPAANACDDKNLVVKPADNITLSPNNTGVKRGYRFLCNGLTVQGTLNLNPGVYVIDGGTFKVNASATITGEGVTIILTGSSAATVAGIDINGGATVNLRAPNATDEPSFDAPEWYGMLLFQDPLATYNSLKIAGDATSSFEGVIYAPKGNVTLTGSAGMTSECIRLVSYTLEISGEATIGNTCDSDIIKHDLGARVVRVVE